MLKVIFIFQALSKNGKIFGNGIMVGVQPCIDKVSNQNICSLISIFLQSIIESSVGTSLTPAVANKSLGAMRPLTAAYHASQSQNEVNFTHYDVECTLSSYRLFPQIPIHHKKIMAL